jgi:hypothetical protein
MSARLKLRSVTQPFALCLLLAWAQPLAAQPPAPTVASDDSARAKTPHEAGVKVSKFEARHIRHACRERANERGVKGLEREAFLSRCFFGRRVGRKERRDCAKLAAAQGLDKTAQRDFIRDCARERRAAPKQPE